MYCLEAKNDSSNGNVFRQPQIAIPKRKGMGIGGSSMLTVFYNRDLQVDMSWKDDRRYGFLSIHYIHYNISYEMRKK